MKGMLFDLSERTGLNRLLQKAGGGKNRLYVLAYHRIGNRSGSPALDPGLIDAAPDQFEAQMEMLVRRYHPVSADDLLAAVRQGTALPRDAVLVTFDDGYRDFWDTAFPVLQRHDIRPVLFVATGCVDSNAFWWDELHRVLNCSARPEVTSSIGVMPLRTQAERETAARDWLAYVKHAPFQPARSEIATLHAAMVPDLGMEPATLSWNELRTLDRAGVAIAAHTHSHPILSHLPLDVAREEIRLSQRIIRQEIGHALPIFAYPDGKGESINRPLADILREEGFLVAFTTVEGRARIGRDDSLLLPRIGAVSSWSLSTFHAHLTPGYDHWKRAWR
jgi:peptidoglycan/xylan/chitin deacetylase (PgdA/CDA1 family)